MDLGVEQGERPGTSRKFQKRSDTFYRVILTAKLTSHPNKNDRGKCGEYSGKSTRKKSKDKRTGMGNVEAWRQG